MKKTIYLDGIQVYLTNHGKRRFCQRVLKEAYGIHDCSVPCVIDCFRAIWPECQRYESQSTVPSKIEISKIGDRVQLLHPDSEKIFVFGVKDTLWSLITVLDQFPKPKPSDKHKRDKKRKYRGKAAKRTKFRKM